MSKRKRGAIIPVDPKGPPLRFDYEPEYESSGDAAIIEVIDRPRRRSATLWMGNEPRTVTLLLTLDRLATNRSIEGDYRRLLKLVRRNGKTDQGTLVRVAARWEHPNIVWWVKSVRPEGERLARADGRRIVQDVIVELVEEVTPRVKLSPAARARRKKKGSK